MRHTPVRQLLLALAGLVALADAQSRPAAPPPQDMSGCWRGEARRAGERIEAFLEITCAKDGTTTVLATVPAMRLRRAPIGGASCRDGVLTFEIPGGGKYRGVFSDDGKRIAGAYATAAEKIPLDFARAAAIPPPRRPQEPVRPYPYVDEAVTFLNDAAGIRFYGTLVIPKGPGPHPAAVMITGAGSHDRDETILEHRPFLVIADYLVRRGIAVLRCDDRGHGLTKGTFVDTTSEDIATDVLASVAYLAGRPDIDAGRIGLIGHSEGGMIAMIAASRSPQIRFVVSLAGVAVKCETLAHQSLEAIGAAHRVSKPLAIAGDLAMSGVIMLMKSSLSDAELAKKLRLFLPPEIVPLLACRWTRFIVNYDPGPAIEKVQCPILGLYCGEDFAVPARPNAAALEAATTRGGNKDVTIITYPRLNHMLQIHAPTAADAEHLDDTVAPEILQKLGEWVPDRARRRSPAGPESR